MNGIPDYTGGAMGGRMLSHPMYDRNGAPAAAAAAAGGSDSALMNSRYAAAPGAADAAGGMDPRLLQQELRRQDLLASSGGFAAAPPVDDNAALLARREEELLQLQDAHNRIMEAELAARAMRDRVVAAQQAQAQDESFRADSIDRIVALQEEQASRQREIERRHVELSNQGFGGMAHHQQAHAMAAERENDRFLGATSVYGGAAGGGRALEEMALRDHYRRRMLEEEAMNQEVMNQEALKQDARKQEAMKQEQIQQQQLQQHQASLNSQQAMMDFGSRGGGGNMASAAEREHLTRLVQLQQMSDEDLIRRAAEVQSAQHVALRESLDRNKSAALEQQLFEAQLARSGLQRFQGERGDDQRLGLDMIDQAHADAAVARRMLAVPEMLGQNKSPMQHLGTSQHSHSQLGASQHLNSQLGTSQHSHSKSPPNTTRPQPLRYFNNGIEVDMDGNPLPTNNNPPPARAPAVQGNQNSASSTSNNLSTSDTNIIAKFLAVVVSRVPEIAPAVAELLPDGGDPMLLKREFPNVVDATLAELKSIQERCSNATGANDADFYRRVSNCIAAIEPYKVDLSTAGSLVPLPAAAPQMMAAAPHMMGMMSRQTLPHALPGPGIDPSSCYSAVSNAYFSAQEVRNVQEELVMAQANKFKSNNDERQSSPPVKKNDKTKAKRTVKRSETKKPESPGDDNMPMMAMYKKKKSAKKSKKRKSSKKSKLSKSENAQLVQHSLLDGSVDLDNAKGAVAPEMNTSKSPSKLDSSSESTQREIKPSSSCAEASEKSRPMKKRRISDEIKENNEDENVDSIPISNIYQKNGQVVKNNDNCGPHGELLNELFGPTKSSADDAKKESKSSGRCDAKEQSSESTEKESTIVKTGAYAENAVITDESEHMEKSSRRNSDDEGEPVEKNDESEHMEKSSRRNSNDEGEPVEEDDGHFGAASVLLGLMGNK